MRFSRKSFIALATALVGLVGAAAPALAADQPVAGEATLVGAQALPPWGVLPTVFEGGFSGLYPVSGQLGQFWTVTDRGPNGDPLTVSGVVRRPFLSPSFAPSIFKVSVDTGTGEMTIIDRIPLQLPVGQVNPARAAAGLSGPTNLITGFGNSVLAAGANIPVNDEIPTTDTDSNGVINASDGVLPLDPYGLDTEGIVVDSRDNTFWLVDEYRPSIIHVAADGTLLQRYTPKGQNSTNLPAWGAVPLIDILPAEYSARQSNRGFEGVAISADGTRLFAIVQNPLASACTGTDANGQAYQTVANRTATRLVELDITTPGAPALVGDYIYTIDTNGSGVPANAQLRISDLAWIGPDQLLVDERDDTAGTAAQGLPSTTYKKIYQIDLKNVTPGVDATNVQSLTPANLSCLDALRPAGVTLRGVVPVKKSLVLDLGSTTQSAEYPFSKLEGLVRRANGNYATVNDNDFGSGATKYIEYGPGAPAPLIPEAKLVLLLPLSALAVGIIGIRVLRGPTRVTERRV